jgi:DNA-binding NarL/FixJ family response regulator
MKKVRLLIVEDNRLLREGITAMIDEQPDLKVVASFGDYAKAQQSISISKPDLLLLDFGLRNQNSLLVVKSIKKNFPDIGIIVMDLIPLESDVLDFVKAGVSGFILKDATTDDFLKTIRAVISGDKVLPQHLTESLFSQIVEFALNHSKPSKLLESVRMTKREKQVIELVAEGLTNKEIAQKLHLSTYTVKSHIHNILEKLALHTRVQIAKYVHFSDNNETIGDQLSLIDE